jgi:CRISPR-associated protein (TIGR03986 family)
MNTVADAFHKTGCPNLCNGNKAENTPLWDFQHSDVWVQSHDQADDYESSNRHLRYRKVTSFKACDTPDHTKGTLVVTGPMQNKKRTFVFVPLVTPEEIEIPHDASADDPNTTLIDQFHDDDQLTKWQRDAFPIGKPKGAKRAEPGWLRDGEPVFFLRENGGLIFFGRAQMFRLPYQNRPLNLVPKALRSPEDVDYAEAIFGYVRASNELKDMLQRKVFSEEPMQGDPRRAYASRVFVTDAEPLKDYSPEELWSEDNDNHVVTPKILASPKPTAFQHYLTQQNPNNSRELDHYDSPPPHKTVIRGHKRYWHQDDRTAKDLRPEPNSPNVDAQGTVDPTSKQHTQFKPVKSGVQFTFRVYFENLSDEELGALCWTLHPLGDEAVMSDPAKGYCHSLGMGKPLGMGAVKLDATLHLTNRPTRYGSLFSGDNWQTGETSAGESFSGVAGIEHLKRRTQKFEEHILRELNNPTMPGSGAQCQHLRDLKRIGMLLKMMEWPGHPATPAPHGLESPSNRVLNDGTPNTRYMTIQLLGVTNPQLKNEYRNRPVLPDPAAFHSDLDQLAKLDPTGTAAATAPASTTPSVLGKGTAPKPKAPPPPPPPVETTKEEWVTLLSIGKKGKSQVRTHDNVEIPCANLGSPCMIKAGENFKAAVTRKDDKPVSAVWKSWW